MTFTVRSGSNDDECARLAEGALDTSDGAAADEDKRAKDEDGQEKLYEEDSWSKPKEKNNYLRKLK